MSANQSGVIAVGAACLIGSLAIAVPARAQDVHVSGGVNVRMASGTFGGVETTTIVYAPAALEVDVNRFEFNGFFPYLSLKNGAGTLSDGGWIPMQGTVSGAPAVGMPAASGMMAGHMSSGSMAQTSPASSQPAAVASPLAVTSGLGDVVATAGYRIVDNVLTGVQVVASTRVKIPTASASAGLGTGRPDIGAAATLRKRFTSGWFYGDVGYVVIGGPANTDVQNAFTWAAGGGRRLRRSLFLLASAYGNTTVLRGYAAPVEVGAGLGVHLATHLNVTAMPTVGLTSASPNYGLTIGLSTDIWQR